jgi:hypothetical protein
VADFEGLPVGRDRVGHIDNDLAVKPVAHTFEHRRHIVVRKRQQNDFTIRDEIGEGRGFCAVTRLCRRFLSMFRIEGGECHGVAGGGYPGTQRLPDFPAADDANAHRQAHLLAEPGSDCLRCVSATAGSGITCAITVWTLFLNDPATT